MKGCLPASFQTRSEDAFARPSAEEANGDLPGAFKMLPIRLLLLVLTISWVLPGSAKAQEPPEPVDTETETGVATAPVAALGSTLPVAEEDLTVEQLAERAKNSIVVVTVTGRDGKSHGLGTGFVVSPEGLIATNLHVIGEARPISVELKDGTQHAVVAVYASDRKLDLALVQIDAKNLPALPLATGEEAAIRQGQPIVVLGNPQGLRHSVVSGVVSGSRKIDEREMIQLAIPIEPGNSGGPVLDMRGRVLGVVTMKSLVTDNLGFAMPIGNLQPLLEKPNTVPIERWLTIGTLNAKEWTTLFGARWQQRAGRIYVADSGEGFAGRALCLTKQKTPELPYEIGVSVKLDDESGAAGLVFNSDGGERHFGFYPSAGKLRLTRFDGNSVYSWNVLFNEASEHYKPGEWNDLKVRIEKDRILCYVNDQLVVESRDQGLPPGRVGLAKFRNTHAEFKRFKIAEKIPSQRIDAQLAKQLAAEVDKLPPLQELMPVQLGELASKPLASSLVLQERAKQLERQAAQMRKLASDVHVQAVLANLKAALEKGATPGGELDLARCALLIARLDNEEVDVEENLAILDDMVAEIKANLPVRATEQQQLDALTKYLFVDNGYHGSRTDYSHQANSYLNRVLEDREGLPITLSLLYMELGRRLGLKIEGVALPGHFVVRFVPQEGTARVLDIFDGAKVLSRDDAAVKVMETTGEPLQEAHLAAADGKLILRRILANLIRIGQDNGDKEAMLRYIEAVVAIDPTSVPDRGMRALLRSETGRRAAAIADLDWFLDEKPAGLDLERIREMRSYFERR
jgi:regulator of sirC expression with transglutaminase-like and TPR domain/S1-C subfamily serine protease